MKIDGRLEKCGGGWRCEGGGYIRLLNRCKSFYVQPFPACVCTEFRCGQHMACLYEYCVTLL